MTDAMPPAAGAGTRPRGVVRARLIEAAVELARDGGPDAVVLREATRRVGVATNAAYRHFADRDELLFAVCIEAMRLLAARMSTAVSEVSDTGAPKQDALARITAVGRSYLDFAREEPGLFRTAFAVPDHLRYTTDPEPAAGTTLTPLDVLGRTLDSAVDAGALPRDRREAAQVVAWSAVHGYAMLRQQGPLRQLPDDQAAGAADAVLAAIERSL